MSEKTKFSIIGFPDFPVSVDKAFQNLTDKPNKSVGETLSDIWFLVFGGLSHLADKRRLQFAKDLELFRSELVQSLSEIPDENKAEPSIQITAQALENSKYCISEPELRQMFATLISSSMDKTKRNQVHPSFAEIIKQMSALDAKIIHTFKYGPSDGFPICKYGMSKKGELGYYTLLENVFLECPDESVFSCSLSISSLIRAGLINIPPNAYYGNPEYYKPFEEHEQFKTYQQQHPDFIIKLHKQRVCLTPLGCSFVNTCIPN